MPMFFLIYGGKQKIVADQKGTMLDDYIDPVVINVLSNDFLLTAYFTLLLCLAVPAVIWVKQQKKWSISLIMSMLNILMFSYFLFF